MQNREIIARAGEIAARTRRDPFRAAKEEGVFVSFGRCGDLPGAYCTVRGVRILLLNERLTPAMRHVVCAHEMGHHFLHREHMPALSRARSPEEEAYIRTTEREANLFAAEFLLEDSAVLAILAEGGDTAAVAAALKVPAGLAAMKRIALGEKELDIPCEEPPAGFLAAVCR